MKIISLVQHKGGSGKSVSSIIIADILSKTGKTLLIDLDDQASTTSYFDEQVGSKGKTASMLNVFRGEKELKDVIINIKNNLDVIPSFLTMSEFNSLSIPRIEYQLRTRLKFLNLDYDYIIIDTPPAMNSLVDNVIIASNIIIIPAPLKKWALESIESVFSRIDKLEEDKEKVRIIATMFEKNLSTQQEFLKLLQNTYNGKYIGYISKRENIERMLAQNRNFDVLNDYYLEYENIVKKIMGGKNE